MIKHVWSVLCRESVVNSENNAISLMNVFEGLKIAKNPSNNQIGNYPVDVPIDYEIVIFLRKDQVEEEKIELKIDLEDPDGKNINKILIPVFLQKGIKNHRQRVKTFGFRISGQGEYDFVISIKQEKANQFKEVSRIPLDVEMLDDTKIEFTQKMKDETGTQDKKIGFNANK